MKKYFTKYEFRWAIIISMLTFVWTIFENEIVFGNTGRKYELYYSLFFVIPAFLFYFLFFQDKKKKRYKNRVKSKHGFYSGLALTILLFIITFPLQCIIYNLYPPLEGAGVFEQDNALIENYFTLSQRIIYWPISTLIFGFIFSVILGFLNEKKKKRIKIN